MIRWFSGEGIANPDWAYTGNEDIALLFPEVIPAGGEVRTGIGMDFDFAERTITGVGILLAGTDDAGNVYEFRTYKDLYGEADRSER